MLKYAVLYKGMLLLWNMHVSEGQFSTQFLDEGTLKKLYQKNVIFKDINPKWECVY